MSEIKNYKNLTQILADKGRLGVIIYCTNDIFDPENLYNNGLIKII